VRGGSIEGGQWRISREWGTAGGHTGVSCWGKNGLVAEREKNRESQKTPQGPFDIRPLFWESGKKEPGGGS